jgi:limonene-1,2-epoxide hydrolase
MRRTGGGSCRAGPVSANVSQKDHRRLKAANVKTMVILLSAFLGLASCSIAPHGVQTMKFNEAEIRQAEQALVLALSSSDPFAWVEHCTEDAVFVAPGAAAVQGRENLIRMARAMRPLSSVQIQNIKTEGSGSLAAGVAARIVVENSQREAQFRLMCSLPAEGWPSCPRIPPAQTCAHEQF